MNSDEYEEILRNKVKTIYVVLCCLLTSIIGVLLYVLLIYFAFAFDFIIILFLFVQSSLKFYISKNI